MKRNQSKDLPQTPVPYESKSLKITFFPVPKELMGTMPYDSTAINYQTTIYSWKAVIRIILLLDISLLYMEMTPEKWRQKWRTEMYRKKINGETRGGKYNDNNGIVLAKNVAFEV